MPAPRKPSVVCRVTSANSQSSGSAAIITSLLRSWFFEVISMSSASGVGTAFFKSFSPPGIGGCSRAGLSGGATRHQGSSSAKSRVSPRSRPHQVSSSSGIASRPARISARAPSCTRKACQAWRWCGRRAGKEEMSFRARAERTPGSVSITESFPEIVLTILTYIVFLLYMIFLYWVFRFSYSSIPAKIISILKYTKF